MLVSAENKNVTDVVSQHTKSTHISILICAYTHLWIQMFNRALTENTRRRSLKNNIVAMAANQTVHQTQTTINLHEHIY